MTLDLLFHKYQRALLETLYESPYESFSINELARRAGVDPGNTKRYVQKFRQNGFVTLTRQGNAVLVRPDLSNPETRKVFELFEIARTKNYLNDNPAAGGILKNIADAIYENLPEVRLVYLFGPSAKALSASCPIDLAVVVGAGLDAEEAARLASDIVKHFALPFETRLSVHGTAEMTKLWKRGEDCGADIWNNRVVLLGEDFFWQTMARSDMPAPKEVNLADQAKRADNV